MWGNTFINQTRLCGSRNFTGEKTLKLQELFSGSVFGIISPDPGSGPDGFDFRAEMVRVYLHK